MPSLPQTLQDTISGQTYVLGEGRQILLRGTGTGNAPIDIAVQIVRSQRQLSGQVQLRTGDHVPLCAGPITNVDAANTLSATCEGYGQQRQLHMTLQALDESSFQGVLRVGHA